MLGLGLGMGLVLDLPDFCSGADNTLLLHEWVKHRFPRLPKFSANSIIRQKPISKG